MTVSTSVTPAMAKRIELWPIDRLRPYARNARTHSPEQVAQIASQWRGIPGFPAYEVSGNGDIRRVVPFRHYPAGMLLRKRLNRFGYWTAALSVHGRRRDVFVHRLVAFAFLGPPPSESHEVAHGDGCRTNNLWTNLRWATHVDNMLDRRHHGTIPDRKGENHPMVRLTEGLVLEMRQRRRDGLTFRELAQEFGFPKLTVYDAITGRTWGHIE